MSYVLKLKDIKSPDGWGGLIQSLGLSDIEASRFFEFGEYASLEIRIDKDLNLTGRILRRDER